MGSPLTASKDPTHQGEVRCQNIYSDSFKRVQQKQGEIHQATVCLLPQASKQECHSCAVVDLRYGDCRADASRQACDIH